MTYYQREKLFFIACLAPLALHLDVWVWDKTLPLLWGWIPYELWYRAALTLSCWALLWWLGTWVWPEPAEDWRERGGCRRE